MAGVDVVDLVVDLVDVNLDIDLVDVDLVDVDLVDVDLGDLEVSKFVCFRVCVFVQVSFFLCLNIFKSSLDALDGL